MGFGVIRVAWYRKRLLRAGLRVPSDRFPPAADCNGTFCYLSFHFSLFCKLPMECLVFDVSSSCRLAGLSASGTNLHMCLIFPKFSEEDETRPADRFYFNIYT